MDIANKGEINKKGGNIMKTRNVVCAILGVLVSVSAVYNITHPQQCVEAKAKYAWLHEPSGLIVESDRPRVSEKELAGELARKNFIKAAREKWLGRWPSSESSWKSRLDKLFGLVILIESGGDPNAVGDNGQAVGIVQIWPDVVKEVNDFEGKAYCNGDRLFPSKSREIFIAYLLRWGAEYERQTGSPPTSYDLIRIWNGGPDGWKKDSTVKYCEKAGKILESL